MEDSPIRQNFTTRFWEYYRILEDDCVILRRFVSFRAENMSTCSDEIIKQLLSVSAEFDGLCKEITGISKERPTIVDYSKWFFTNQNNSNLKQTDIVLKNSDIILQPFLSWGATKDDIMPWWEAYNLVKHDRNKNYTFGTLKNLLDALSALYFLECYQYKQISLKYSTERHILFDVPPDQSKLFYIKDFKTKSYVFGHDLFGSD
ncbi:hypothetical protein IJU85_01215 [Candidatus Saccharibacteria bacterium]|nr:hypothetical protein [Candidatus Saccharibacteria bacterium]